MPDEPFQKETVEKDDGRHIIFYTFDGTPDDELNEGDVPENEDAEKDAKP